MRHLIEAHRRSIAELCVRHGVRKLEMFGSALRDDFDAGHSDVDLLVEFKPEVAADFGNFLDLQEALEALLQRPVDLLEPHTIRNRRLRHHINHGKAPVYDAP